MTIAVVRANGDTPPSPSSTRAGADCSRGSSRQASPRSATELAAAVGPAIGPCCYEVGEEVAEPFERRFGAGLMHGRKLDLWTAAERALRAAGCPMSTASTCAPAAIRSSSSRSGAPAVRAAPTESSALSADDVRERYERIRAEVGPDVTVVAATKYVSLDDMAALVEAGVEVVGENRAQDLAAKHERYGDAFRWHFIGHLQSRKAKLVNDVCELVHSLASESAARRLGVPALVEVNLSGRRRSRASRPRSWRPSSGSTATSAA